MAVGRPNKYEINVKLRLTTVKAWSRDGLTRAQIAKNLRIHISTLIKYAKKYPEFNEALKEGLDDHVAEVENAHAKSALGFTYEERKVCYDVDKEGKPTRVTKIEVVTKEAHPNITAGIFILKNRAPAKWRDRRNAEDDDSKVVDIRVTLAGDKD